ncbi:DUF1900-domain-containing protein [Xylona heveae TC161]|uniref:Coronin n=1 Tax=Xylona heveae (strain CBS 132557 / TC161) TaxID=1328760 RepID=A0A165G254_XYLHT|nr:DUF1900-domain-containing protein [Xylona heveae TC161]KZF21652.1 DUF1900-domain-containing protein [Xylona heveae TC161]
MSGRFVRASKYRHVFGRPTKKEQCYDNLRISHNAWDTNLVKANPKYLSVNWESGGGGAFAVLPLEERGRLPELIPLFRGHTAAVLDTDWHPFDDSLVVSGSDDAKAFLWKVPEDFTLYTDAEEPQDVAPIAKLSGHTRKIGHTLFNPAAANVLATASGDYTIKIWDIEAEKPNLTLKHGDIIQSLSWSGNGSMLVTTCRDKKVRIWDPRQERAVQEMAGHPGAKNSRVVWMGEHDRVATTGFSKMSDRQLGLWDIRGGKEPLGGFKKLDSISGVCMPFWDDGTQCLYLAGKGDGNIRYFEYENDKFEFLAEYKSTDPQRGIAFLPKRGVNVHENEVMRAYKTVNDTYIEPVSFIVPRRAEVFQADIFPPAVGLKPAMSAKEWFDGKEASPPKISLEDIYNNQEPSEVPADFQPPKQPPKENAALSQKSATPSPAPTAKATAAAPAPEPAKEAAPVNQATTVKPPPSVNDTKSAMADAAAKFADKAEESSSEDDDDNSSFEEIPKPTERFSAAAVASRMEEKTHGPQLSLPPHGLAAKQERETPAAKEIKQLAATSSAKPEEKKPTPISSPSPQPQQQTSKNVITSSLTTDMGPIQDSLHEIKQLLSQQTRTLAVQNDKIAQLTAEVDTLKTRVGEARSSRDKDERIRQLELELEQSRS